MIGIASSRTLPDNLRKSITQITDPSIITMAEATDPICTMVTMATTAVTTTSITGKMDRDIIITTNMIIDSNTGTVVATLAAHRVIIMATMAPTVTASASVVQVKVVISEE